MRKVRPGWYTTEVIGFEEAFEKKIKELKVDVSRRKLIGGGTDWVVSTRSGFELDVDSGYVTDFYTASEAKAYAKAYVEYLKSEDLPRPLPYLYASY